MQELVPHSDHGLGPYPQVATEPDGDLPADMKSPALEPNPSAAARSPLLFTLPRVAALVMLWVVLQYLVPYLLEQYQYAATRGRQRAEYEIAAQGLQTLPLDGLSKACQMVSLHVGPSVVHIDVRTNAQEVWPRDIARRLGPPNPDAHGQGSGVVVDPKGYIVTNQHVVQNSHAIRVSLADGRVLPARVIGVDPMTDLAVLKIDADNLIAAQWGDSDVMEVGALVWAVGSPFGLQSTTTFGILSGKHRSGMAGEVYQDFLQTDAAVNPGNSGGPLVDVRGRIVGINTAILGEAYQGVSFAIPSSVAQPVYQRLKSSGHVARGWLGVELRPVEDEDVLRAGLPSKQGAWIIRCHDGNELPSPARLAGIRPGDVIIRWSTQVIAKPEELIRAVAATEIGTEVIVVVIRDGVEMSLPVQVAERPSDLRS